jgi:hypothetical protein
MYFKKGGGMTGAKLVREFFPNATDDECEGLLWQCTCFPAMGGDDKAIEYYRTQLRDMAEKSNSIPVRAMAIADAEISEAMKDKEA